MERTSLVVRHVEGFPEDYARTLGYWIDSFESRFDEAVRLAGIERARVWRVYLRAARAGLHHRLRLGLPGARPQADERWYELAGRRGADRAVLLGLESVAATAVSGAGAAASGSASGAGRESATALAPAAPSAPSSSASAAHLGPYIVLPRASSTDGEPGPVSASAAAAAISTRLYS